MFFLNSTPSNICMGISIVFLEVLFFLIDRIMRYSIEDFTNSFAFEVISLSVKL